MKQRETKLSIQTPIDSMPSCEEAMRTAIAITPRCKTMEMHSITPDEHDRLSCWDGLMQKVASASPEMESSQTHGKQSGTTSAMDFSSESKGNDEAALQNFREATRFLTRKMMMFQAEDAKSNGPVIPPTCQTNSNRSKDHNDFDKTLQVDDEEATSATIDETLLSEVTSFESTRTRCRTWSSGGHAPMILMDGMAEEDHSNCGGEPADDQVDRIISRLIAHDAASLPNNKSSCAADLLAFQNACGMLQNHAYLASQEAIAAVKDTQEALDAARGWQDRATKAFRNLRQYKSRNQRLLKKNTLLQHERQLLIQEVKCLRKKLVEVHRQQLEDKVIVALDVHEHCLKGKCAGNAGKPSQFGTTSEKEESNHLGKELIVAKPPDQSESSVDASSTSEMLFGSEVTPKANTGLGFGGGVALGFGSSLKKIPQRQPASIDDKSNISMSSCQSDKTARRYLAIDSGFRQSSRRNEFFNNRKAALTLSIKGGCNTVDRAIKSQVKNLLSPLEQQINQDTDRWSPIPSIQVDSRPKNPLNKAGDGFLSQARMSLPSNKCTPLGVQPLSSSLPSTRRADVYQWLGLPDNISFQNGGGDPVASHMASPNISPTVTPLATYEGAMSHCDPNIVRSLSIPGMDRIGNGK